MEANAIEGRRQMPERLGTAQRDQADREVERNGRQSSIDDSPRAVENGNSSAQQKGSGPEPMPVLAVRSGLPSKQETTDAVERQLRQKLQTGSKIAQASQVSSGERPTQSVDVAEVQAKAAQKVEIASGDGSSGERQELEVAGSDASKKLNESRPPAPTSTRVDTSAGPKEIEDVVRQERDASQVQAAQSQEKTRAATEPSKIASETASNAGGVKVQTSEDRPGANAASEKAGSPGKDAAEQFISQAGGVEASNADSIVTRFFNNTAPDPSDRPEPTPKTEETHSERSVPASYYA